MPIRFSSAGRLAPAATVILGISVGSASAQSIIAYTSGGPALVHNIGAHDVAWQVGGGAEARSGPVGFGGGLDYVYFPAADRRRAGVSSSSPAASALAPFIELSGHAGEPTAFRGYDDSPRLRPFVSGGFTFLTGSGETIPMLHVAGGVDWWATRNTGLRVEVRTQLGGMVAVRCGLVIR